MSTQVKCPHCQVLCGVPAEALGRTVRCARCNQTFRAEPDSEVMSPGAASTPKVEQLTNQPLPPTAPTAMRRTRPAVSAVVNGGRSQKTGNPFLVIALVGSVVLLFGCLTCLGAGVIYLWSIPSSRATSPVARASPRPVPEPVAQGPFNQFPGPIDQPDLNRPLENKPVDFPPAQAAERADERIHNGDFEQGAKGFRSAYRQAQDGLREEFMFAIVEDPSQVHFQAARFGDHTSGRGLMMAVNGANIVNGLLWGQTVAVRPGADYTFSLWVTSWFPSAPAELEVRINGNSIGKIVAPLECGQWKELSVKWNAGTDREAAIEIFDLTSAHSGNDFAIDDISLRGPRPD